MDPFDSWLSGLLQVLVRGRGYLLLRKTLEAVVGIADSGLTARRGKRDPADEV